MFAHLLSGLCHVDPSLSVVGLEVNGFVVSSDAIPNIPHACLTQPKQIPGL